MVRVCPRCRGTTPDLLCPQCGVRTADADAPPAAGPAAGDEPPATGLLVGLLLAQGLYYALRHLATAWLLASGTMPEAEFWGSFRGLITLQGLQMVALLVGGIVLPISAVLALFVIAGATLLLLIMGIRNAWDIVTYMLIEVPQSQNKSQD